MQQTTGTLSPGAHPGSYNGQDAYSDLLIYDGKAGLPHKGFNHQSFCPDINRLQGSTDNFEGGYNMNVVRRLTPLECTRLQGFPDGWVEIGDWVDSKGKTHKDADSPKYKALGNSVALPFWEWLARKIAAQYERPITMGSLFSGLGGFELAFQRAGGKPVWASEIEEFPIAVTKLRFPDE